MRQSINSRRCKSSKYGFGEISNEFRIVLGWLISETRVLNHIKGLPSQHFSVTCLLCFILPVLTGQLGKLDPTDSQDYTFICIFLLADLSTFAISCLFSLFVNASLEQLCSLFVNAKATG